MKKIFQACSQATPSSRSFLANLRIGLGTLALVGLLFTFPNSSLAQKFKSEKINPKYDHYSAVDKKKRDSIIKARRNADKKVEAAIAGGSLSSSSLTWIKDVRMNDMASNQLAALKDLGINRRYILDVVNGSSGATRQRLIDLIIEKSSAVAKDNYHPAARVNAVRLMASLQDRSFNSASKRPPRFSQKAINKVLEIANDQASPAFLQAACLNGLAGVAKLDGQVRQDHRIQPGVRKQIVDFAMKTLTLQGDKLKGGTVSGYLARRSVQILGDLDLDTVKYADIATVKAALQKVADNSNADIWTRFDAMNGLYNLGIDEKERQNFVRSLGKLVVLISKMEAGYIEHTLAEVKMREEIKKEVVVANADGGGGQGARSGSRSSSGGKGGQLSAFGGGATEGGADNTTTELYEGILHPFHLRRVRTNVKTAVGITKRIIGAGSKAKTGMRIEYRTDPELVQLIKDVALPLDELVDATDIGLAVRKKKNKDDELDLDEKEAEMRKAHLFKRVPFEINKAVKDLEAVVGSVNLPPKKG